MDFGSEPYCMIQVTKSYHAQLGSERYSEALNGLILKARPPLSKELDNFFDERLGRFRSLEESERTGICAVDIKDFLSALAQHDPDSAEWFRRSRLSFSPYTTTIFFFPDQYSAD